MICEQFLKFNPLPLTTLLHIIAIDQLSILTSCVTTRLHRENIPKGMFLQILHKNREERGYTFPPSRTLERKKHPEAALYPQNLTRVCVLCVSVCVQWPEGRCFHDVPESALLNLYFEIRENCHGFS